MNHLNELIALELGWRDIRPSMSGIGRGQSTGIPPGELRTYVPNWAGDLNLMHELEGSYIQDREWSDYMDEVQGGRFITRRKELVHTTAEQKAIAWLKVKGVTV